MSYKSYNTRNSGRFNTSGNFVSAGGLGDTPSLYDNQGAAPRITFNKPIQQNQSYNSSQNQNNQIPPLMQQSSGYTTANPTPSQMPPPPIQPPLPPASTTEQEVKCESESESTSGVDCDSRPLWMRSKLLGVKKITNKERRRRQNENLRRLLTPKNALMVLNEILPGEQVTNNFKVEAASASAQYFKPSTTYSYSAELAVNGNTYRGFGENKLQARNQAAEQAIRDLMLQRMQRLLSAQAAEAAAAMSDATPAGDEPMDSPNGESKEGSSEEVVPMIQLCSYALHKLFTEWEVEGHKVPHLRPIVGTQCPASDTGSDCGSPLAAPPRPKVAKVRELPAGATTMHPGMLLTYMRPMLEYRELSAEGNLPHQLIFTMAIDVDGQTFTGRAQNKKEARKLAAKAACETLFKVRFDN